MLRGFPSQVNAGLKNPCVDATTKDFPVDDSEGDFSKSTLITNWLFSIVTFMGCS